MKDRLGLLAFAALALGTAACGRGCTCFSGEKTYETLDAKYDVSLVRKTHWTGGKIPGPISNFYIHVETTPPIDEPLGDCTHADMAEDDEGKHVAFRCKDKNESAWTVLRLRGGDRRIRECEAPVGTGSKPEWQKLESVRASTTRILGCQPADRAYVMKELAHAVLEDEGPAVAGDYVNGLAAWGSTTPPDPWDAAFAILDAPAQTIALDKLCTALKEGKAEPAPYVRAARHCPLDSSGALATLRALLATKMAERDNGTITSAFVWAALLAAKRDPKEAGAALCQAANEGVVNLHHAPRQAIAAALIGQTNTKCAIVSSWMMKPPCNFLLDCDGGLCTPQELAEDLAGWNGELDAGSRDDPSIPDRDRAILYATYAAGPLPKELVIPNQRRHYELPDAGDLPYCSDNALDAGAPCNATIRSLDVCDVPPAATVLERYNATIHIDDAHKRLDMPRRVCMNLGASCSSHPCCGDAVCKGEVCAVKPPRDAGPPDAGGD